MIGFVLFKEEKTIDKIFVNGKTHQIGPFKVKCKRAMLREELKQVQIEEAKKSREENVEERKKKKREKKKKRKLKKKEEKDQLLKEGREEILSIKKEILGDTMKQKIKRLFGDIEIEEHPPNTSNQKPDIFESVFLEEKQDKIQQIPKLTKESDPFIPPVNYTNINRTAPVNFQPPKISKGIGRLLNPQTMNSQADYMGYPAGIYANSITPENRKKVEVGDSNTTPLSGFGLHRELDGKIHSDLGNQRKLVNSLIQAKEKTNRSDIPRTRVYHDYEDFNEEDDGIDGDGKKYKIEDFKGLRKILDDEHNYSVDEDVEEDEIEEIEQNFV